MDSNDIGEFLLLMLLDDDLFFVDIDADEQEQEDVETVQSKSNWA